MKATAVQLFCVALLVRVVFIAIGYFLDSSGGGLQYTDIDYHVFSDAADLVARGLSPYERSTYRYPPLLSLLLVPNVYVSFFGKLLFSIADAAIIFELRKLLDRFDPQYSSFYCWLWVFNIASINICTRGSADSITNYLVLLSLRLVLNAESKPARQGLVGVVLGALIYLRVYPVIYLPAYVYYCIINSIKANTRVEQGRAKYSYLYCTLSILYTTAVLLVSTTLTLALLMRVSYYYYGEDYLQNAVLYHLSREDHRHNFSVHYYGIYLSKYTTRTYTQLIVNTFTEYTQRITNYLFCSGGDSSDMYCSVASGDYMNQIATFYPTIMSVISGFLPSVMLFIPHSLLFAATVATFAHTNLPLCLLLQTMVFVSYNKVITAQYFSWYLCLIPLCMQTIRAIPSVVLVLVSALWGGSLAYWLYCAYLLEFAGESVYYSVWVASVVFHVATTAVVGTIVCYAT